MKLKTYHVALDRPGAGWSDVVYATCGREAMILANKSHPNMGLADTCYEIPTTAFAEHNYKMTVKNLKRATELLKKAREKFHEAMFEEQVANSAFAKARAIYNISREEN